MLGLNKENDSLFNSFDGEPGSKRCQNTTECVLVPSSEHVAEIVEKQGAMWQMVTRQAKEKDPLLCSTVEAGLVVDLPQRLPLQAEDANPRGGPLACVSSDEEPLTEVIGNPRKKQKQVTWRDPLVECVFFELAEGAKLRKLKKRAVKSKTFLCDTMEADLIADVDRLVSSFIEDADPRNQDAVLKILTEPAVDLEPFLCNTMEADFIADLDRVVSLFIEDVDPGNQEIYSEFVERSRKKQKQGSSRKKQKRVSSRVTWLDPPFAPLFQFDKDQGVYTFH